MRKSLVLLALFGAHVPVLLDAAEPAGATQDSGVQLAVAEFASTDKPGDQIELTSGTADRSAYWRPGLLGQRYFESRYHHFDFSDDPFVELFDDTIQGLDGTLNIPILSVGEATDFLGIDAFAGHRFVSVSGELRIPPPVDLFASLDVDEHVTYVGTSVYVDHAHFGPVRPFIQLGVEFFNLKFRSNIDGVIDKATDDEVELLVAPGLEIDLGDRAAIRATFDLVEDVMDNSTFFGDIILWPWDRVFIRGGFAAPLSGDGTGGIIGGGVTF